MSGSSDGIFFSDASPDSSLSYYINGNSRYVPNTDPSTVGPFHSRDYSSSDDRVSIHG